MRQWILAALVLAVTSSCVSCSETVEQPAAQGMAPCVRQDNAQHEGRSITPLRSDVTFQGMLGAVDNNLLVRNAIDTHERAVIDSFHEYHTAVDKARGEGDSQKKIEALTVEQEQKLEGLKTACLEALRRAGGVSKSMNHYGEAAAIAALADQIANSEDNKRFTQTEYR